jgi:hypoxanthine phosphoribosyltransferase
MVVKRLAQEITDAYIEMTEELVLVGVLKGSIMFLADLAREINLPFTMDFIIASHTSAGTDKASGIANITHSPEPSVFDHKHVLIVEDIIDSGATIERVVHGVRMWSIPTSVEVCTLLHKSKPGEELRTHARFIGFNQPPPGFVVGYGFDQGEWYRGLPFIALKEED